MEDIYRIAPGKVGGTAVIPASKSLCHRAILAASLAKGRSVIENISLSQDIEATIAVARALGASVLMQEDGSLQIDGAGGQLTKKTERLLQIDCGESGSTLRFVVPILAALGLPACYTGRGKLGERPMQVYYDLFDGQGMDYETNGGHLPLTVRSPLKAGQFTVDGSISSQFVTGLLMALPLLEGDSQIRIQGSLQSRPYVNLTLSVLGQFGIRAEESTPGCFIIRGGQSYQPAHYRVEADASQAAFWICAGGIAGSPEGLQIQDLNPQTAQGDLAFLEAYQAMGGQYCWERQGLRVFPSHLEADLEFDVSQCPDIVPILAVLGCYNQGKLHITGAGRLRIKESDRLAAIRTELNRMGARVREEDEGLWIYPAKLIGGEAESWNDHRIAMAVAVAALGCQREVILKGAGSVRKSWPTFWNDLEKVRVYHE